MKQSIFNGHISLAPSLAVTNKGSKKRKVKFSEYVKNN